MGFGAYEFLQVIFYYWFYVLLPLGKPLWPIVMQVEDVGKSESYIVMMQIL